MFRGHARVRKCETQIGLQVAASDYLGSMVRLFVDGMAREPRSDALFSSSSLMMEVSCLDPLSSPSLRQPWFLSWPVQVLPHIARCQPRQGPCPRHRDSP